MSSGVHTGFVGSTGSVPHFLCVLGLHSIGSVQFSQISVQVVMHTSLASPVAGSSPCPIYVNRLPGVETPTLSKCNRA